MALLESQDDVRDQNPSSLQHAPDLADEFCQVEDMIEGVRVDGGKRPVGKNQVMKIAVEHIRVGFSGVEVHPYREVTELDQGANLGSDPGAEAQDGVTPLQRGAAGKVCTKAIQILAFHAAQPALDLPEFA